MTCLIIAEAGVNHNGDERLAFQLVDEAVKAGADVVKFQTFKSELLATKDAKQAQYQQKNSQVVESQLAMLKRLELSHDCHKRLQQYCQQQGIEYLSTAFDEQSLRFLVDEIGLTRLKIPSGELTNAPFILQHALTGCDLIISTGMATVEEIHFALAIISFGLLNLNQENITPSEQAFLQAYESEAGQALLQKKVTILHCTTEYPAPYDEVNLNALPFLANEFHLPVGYSDHTVGIVVSTAAVVKGAVVIEKHFTLDRNLPGPDHKASLEPDELKQLINDIRIVEQALGRYQKQTTQSELKNIAVARKSIFAKHDIKKGQLITSEDLDVMRPGDGLSARYYFQIVNTVAKHDYLAGETLRLD